MRCLYLKNTYILPYCYLFHFLLYHIIMRFDRDPDRSPSPSPPPFDEENTNNDTYDEAELLVTIAEKEAEMRRTQELLDERMRQMEVMLTQLHRVNRLLEQFEILALGDVNRKC